MDLHTPREAAFNIESETGSIPTLLRQYVGSSKRPGALGLCLCLTVVQNRTRARDRLNSRRVGVGDQVSALRKPGGWSSVLVSLAVCTRHERRQFFPSTFRRSAPSRGASRASGPMFQGNEKGREENICATRMRFRGHCITAWPPNVCMTGHGFAVNPKS